MKSFFEEYSRFIGLLLLTFVIIMLFSTPSLLVGKSITTIDTELSHASGDAMPVRTMMDLGSNEYMRAFPRQVGDWEDWKGADYNTTRVAESLGADVMLMRAYTKHKLYPPIYFLIVQSNNRSSFHPPIVCYPALGYTIEEEATEEIFVHNASWASKPLFATWESKKEELGCFNGTISAKKLVVVKESEEDGKVTERRVVLYYYVKENPFASDTFTMVRVSALAPLEGSYDESLNLTKEFMGATMPSMFELRKDDPVLFIRLASGSVIGKVAIGLLFLPPLTILFYPRIKKHVFYYRNRGER